VSKNVTIWVFAGVVVVAILSVLLMGMSYTNREIELRNQAGAQQKANEVVYDELWKVLQQKAGILDKYATDFKSVYTSLFDERYQGENAGQSPAFKWITEQNPNFSMEMYKDLLTAVEVYRGKFSRVQQRLLDIKREHQNIRQRIPGCWFVGGKPELEITIVTSTKTDKVFAAGKEDSVDLFNKK
jgi:hypothetical protein